MAERIVARFHRTGGPEVLALDRVEVGDPGAGEVRIGVKALGLNRAELAFMAGRYLERPALPSRIGYEAAGVVEAIGDGVSELGLGDRVAVLPLLSMSRHGVAGEVATVPASIVRRLPDGLGFERAAACWMQYLTAWGGLFDGAQVQAGDVVVVTAASSSVGLAAIALVREAGGIPIATTRTGEKREALLAAGAELVIVTGTETVGPAVRAVTGGRGARVIFDAVAGPGVAALAEAAAEGGTIVVYGALAEQFTPFPVALAIGKGLTVRGWSLRDLVRSGALARAIEAIEAGVGSGRWQPVVARRFGLEQIGDAYRFMASGAQVGKVVVTVP